MYRNEHMFQLERINHLQACPTILHNFIEHRPTQGTEKLLSYRRIYLHFTEPGGPCSVVGIATRYGLDGPGIDSRWGARFPAPVQIGPGAHSATCTTGTGSFPGVKSGRGVTLTPHPLLVLRSWKSRAIPLLPLWTVRPVQSLSTCTRVTFTLTLQKPKAHYRIHKSPSLAPILSLVNSLIVIAFHTRLGIPCGVFPWGFTTKILYAFFFLLVECPIICRWTFHPHRWDHHAVSKRRASF
jgi:hypothetical protein